MNLFTLFKFKTISMCKKVINMSCVKKSIFYIYKSLINKTSIVIFNVPINGHFSKRRNHARILRNKKATTGVIAFF